MNLSKIVDCEVENIEMSDAWDFCNAYISSAYYDLGCGKFRRLSEKQLDTLNSKHSDFVYEKVMEHLF